jgi:hypothetical protein
MKIRVGVVLNPNCEIGKKKKKKHNTSKIKTQKYFICKN